LRFSVGVDLGGRKSDPSAVAVLEATYFKRDNQDMMAYETTYLHRFARQHDYATIAKKLVEGVQGLAMAADEEHKRPEIILTLDATGIGTPICELVEKAFEASGTLPTINRVFITGGTNVTEGDWGPMFREYHVPKVTLVSGVQAALAANILSFSGRLKEIDRFYNEMSTFERFTSDAGRDTYGGRPDQGHFDMLIAVCLATWALDWQGAPTPLVW
jgi:hypothetical protein